jgi:ABC-type branched-subunit amino acid transport system substrate-binding protein/DNA-binding beta-propeller fold protein YncE
MTARLDPGSTFAGYRIESLVGRGGMGVVYQATDLSLGRPVALKLIAPELADDARFRERFLDEPRLAASLDHASVIPIYEAGEHDGQLYLAMRYVPGSDLRTLLEREGVLAPERALAILAQIAGALDAAHRQGLVHRDVKPANVLLDEDEHAYLTDFGITKQLSDDTGDAGHGTLDYLAPEQIRGEPVDGRTDGYALACVLYECLAGVAPFRRQTPAETMWAHLREDPPTLESPPALAAVLQRGLAQERDDRYPTCAALIDAAHDVLAPRTSRIRMLVVAGIALIAVAIAGALLASRPGEESGAAAKAPEGNGVAAIDPGSEQEAEFVEMAGAPSNVTVGNGAVYVLNADGRTISRIDPKTKAIAGRVESPGGATDIAAGAGAVWVGTGEGQGGNWTDTVHRIDAATNLTRTVHLPRNLSGGDRFDLNSGFTQMAIGAGAVWVTGGGGVARLDPRTGALVATVKADATRLAAGREGIWYISVFNAGAVTRIDPRTNRTGRVIDVGDAGLSGIAVGAGSVWVTAEREGVVFRITLGARPSITPINVGTGVNYVAYGAGAVWAASYVTGILSRIDPRTNAVVAETPIGAVQSLAAGAGSAWASTAGATRAGTLPASVCTDESGGGKADVLIASDLPLQEESSAPRAMADAIHAVLAQHGFRAGKYAVGYRSCDDSTQQAASYELRRCAANANAYAGADRLVALIGPMNSGCSQVELPILNKAPGGPLAVISPTNSDPGLTQRGTPPPEGNRGTPEIYYPLGTRHFVRLLSPENLYGAAEAVLAAQLGLKRVYVLFDGAPTLKHDIVDPFRRTASRRGVGIAGSTRFNPDTAKGYGAIARKVERSGADGVLFASGPFRPAVELLVAVRERLGSRVPVMVTGEFGSHGTKDLFAEAGAAVRGVYVPALGLPRTAFPLTAAARRAARTIDAEVPGALEAAQATEIVLGAIARSDGTRASVLAELRSTKVKDGILGTFGFDDNGDMTPGWVPIVRITRPADSQAWELEGAVADRVVQPPPSAGESP